MARNLTPASRPSGPLATISACAWCVRGAVLLRGAGPRPDDKTIATLPHNLWYAIGMSSNASLSAAAPTGPRPGDTGFETSATFMLYGLTNIICIVAFREHDDFHGFKHMVVPNLWWRSRTSPVWRFYIIGPIEGPWQRQRATDRSSEVANCLGHLWRDLFQAQFRAARVRQQC